MDSPPMRLLEAVSRFNSDGISLIIGAGTSVPGPTSLLTADALSVRVHEKLMDDHVLDAGDCADPADLSAVAASVRSKTTGQSEMVRRMDPERLHNAPPNAGHHCAVALVLEGIIKSVATLNFDLSMSHALVDIGARGRVAIVKSADDWQAARSRSLIYLHQNIDCDWDDLVLTVADLDATWEEGWQRIVTVAAVATPIALFAGLGSPATVLVESVRMVRASLPHSEIFLASPGGRPGNRFATELAVDNDHFIEMGWVELMRELSGRTILEHKRHLMAVNETLAAANGWPTVNLEPLFDRVASLGIALLGKLRGMWIRQENDYLPMAEDQPTEGMVEILLGIALFEGATDSEVRIDASGVLEFRRGNAILGRALCASGRGVLSESAVVTAAIGRMRYAVSADPVPDVILVTGTLVGGASPAPPVDIVQEPEFGNVVTADLPPMSVRLSELRGDPDALLRAWRGVA